jgi:uncharacterized protein YecE (DUF72 family)
MTAGWARATGPSFKFCLKMPKTITHDRKLVHAEKDTSEFMERIEPITKSGKLGCLLIQLPPSFAFGEKKNLESYFESLPQDVHFAVEFRHESWDRDETWDILRKFNVANTITDSPIPFLSKPVITTSTHAYVRWHGRGKSIWYDYRYSDDEIMEWQKKLKIIEKRVPTLYAYFNNHYGANAPSNLLLLLSMRGELTEPQAKVVKRIERSQKKQDNAVAKLTDFF